METNRAEQPTLRRWPARLFTAVVLVGFLASCVGVFTYVDDLVECSPPSQYEVVTQRDFVKATLADARDFEVEVMDCDDNGVGYVGFSSHLSPVETREVFVTGAGCRPGTDDGSDTSVKCVSRGVEVSVSFEPAEGGGTDGSLTLK